MDKTIKELRDEQKESLIKISLLILDWLETHTQEEFMKLNISNVTHHGAGMCHVAHLLCEEEKIKMADDMLFEFFIFNYTKQRYKPCDVYIFKPGKLKPRINFLTELLKKL